MPKLAQEILAHGVELQQQITERYHSLGRFSLFYNLFVPESLANWSLPAPDEVHKAVGLSPLTLKDARSMIAAQRTELNSRTKVDLYAETGRFGSFYSIYRQEEGQSVDSRLGSKAARPYVDEFLSLNLDNLVDDSRKSPEAQERGYRRMLQGLQQLENHHGVPAEHSTNVSYVFNVGGGRHAHIFKGGYHSLSMAQMYIQEDKKVLLQLLGTPFGEGFYIGGSDFRGSQLHLEPEPAKLDALLRAFDTLCSKPERSSLMVHGGEHPPLRPEVTVDLRQFFPEQS